MKSTLAEAQTTSVLVQSYALTTKDGHGSAPTLPQKQVLPISENGPMLCNNLDGGPAASGCSLQMPVKVLSWF